MLSSTFVIFLIQKAPHLNGCCLGTHNEKNRKPIKMQTFFNAEIGFLTVI